MDAGFHNPLENNFAVQNLKKGIARQLGSPPEQKLPITCTMLSKMKELLDPFNAKHIAFWAACIIGFFGFLRKSTLLPISMVKPGDGCILRKDLDMPDCKTVVLYIRKTKTIQCKERVLVMPYVASPGNPLCPVKALNDLLSIAPMELDLPLFGYFDEDDCPKYLTHNSFTTLLKLFVDKVGYDSTKYSGHSLRRGGATLGFQVGLSITQIKKRGDWTSSAVNSYIHVSKSKHNEIAKILVPGSQFQPDD